MITYHTSRTRILYRELIHGVKVGGFGVERAVTWCGETTLHLYLNHAASFEPSDEGTRGVTCIACLANEPAGRPS